MSLNEQQQKAVGHADGALLVTASPGSGKTRVVMERTAALIARNVDPGRILLCTFTNKTAAEMKQRLAKIAGPAAKRVYVSTMHSLSARMLRTFDKDDLDGRTKKYTIYDDSDCVALVREIIGDLELDKKKYKAGELCDKISRLKAAAATFDDMPEDTEAEANGKLIWQRYEAGMRAANAFDFDDLILRFMYLAEADSSRGKDIRGRFDYVLVDEYQDTNETQYRLVRALGRRTGNVCVVADRQQAIYSFRGAAPGIVDRFAEEREPMTVFLDTCYRSSPQVVLFCNELIGPAEERDVKTPHGDRQPVRVRQHSDEHVEAKSVVTHIRQLQEHGVTLGEMAILYRTHTAAAPVEEELIRRAIPYHIVKGTKFFDRQEVRDLLSYLRLIENPLSYVDFARVVNKPKRGVGKGGLGRIERRARELKIPYIQAAVELTQLGVLKRDAPKAMLNLRHVLTAGRDSSKKPSEICRQIIADTGYKTMWLNELARLEDRHRQGDAERKEVLSTRRRVEAIDKFVDMIASYENRLADPQKATIEGYLEHVALLADQDDVDQDEARVLLMTVHASKGLEFDAVWVLGVEDGNMPLLHEDDAGSIAEERRLLYVACSRARHHLTLSYTISRLRYGKVVYPKPSRFLFDVSEEACSWPERQAHSDPLVTAP